MIGQINNKPVLNFIGAINRIRNRMDRVQGVKETYGLLQNLSAVKGINISEAVLDRVMYSTETLPPLGKEYWWFLFFGRDGENPVQLMLLIFRKHGHNMLFNDKEMALKELAENKFQAVTAGWIYDGKEIHDLGDTNAVTMISPERKTIISNISGQKIMLNGGFPDYKLKVGNIIDLNITKGDYIKNNDAHSVYIPPFGVAWVDAFSNAEGTVLEKNFKGTAHLQKVVGITIPGSFHWGRICFHNGSSTSFFCLKTGKDLKRFFHKSITFYDNERREIIQFKKPRLKISKKEEKTPIWIIEGQDEDKKFRTVLEVYATKKFTMKGGGSQVYIEYAVTPREFNLKTHNKIITLNDLGKGVGTFEDAYGSPI